MSGNIVASKTCFTKSIDWKIPDFFLIAKIDYNGIRSPSFSFFGRKWFLKVHPNGDTNGTKGRVLISIYCELTPSSEIHVDYQMGIKKQDGSELSVTGVFEFGSENIAWSRELCKQATLYKYKQKNMLQNAVIVFCVMSVKNAINEGRTSLTSSFESTCWNMYYCNYEHLDGSTETSEEDFKKLEYEVEDEETQHISAGTDELAQSLKDVFISGEHHDTIIKVKEEEFRTHKFILVIRSSVFASMFRPDRIERSTGVITIEDCDPAAFREFLSYLYSGKLENLCTGNVLDLYFIADKYEVEGVKAECVKFMISNFSVDNFCDCISWALRHDEKKLVKSATDYFTKNVKTIIATMKWQRFHEEYPVESNELYIKAIMHRVPD